MLHLVLGGARSGKSSFAEQWLLKQSTSTTIRPIYMATAQALDDEMIARIAHHKQLRGNENWQLIECPLNLSESLAELSKLAFIRNKDQQLILVDCLTLWLTNQLMSAMKLTNNNKEISEILNKKVEQLLSSLIEHPAIIVLVANEIGLGVIPMGKETRLFVDHAGWLNQKLAAMAEQVTLVTAGIPQVIKTQGNIAKVGEQENARG